MKNRKSEAAKILLENGFELEEVNGLLNPIKLNSYPYPPAAAPQIHVYPVQVNPVPLNPFSPSPWQPSGAALPAVSYLAPDN